MKGNSENVEKEKWCKLRLKMKSLKRKHLKIEEASTIILIKGEHRRKELLYNIKLNKLNPTRHAKLGFCNLKSLNRLMEYIDKSMD